jgi:mannitol/fructose-specific phosphotransferase system IIA component
VPGVLAAEAIRLGLAAGSKEDAIVAAGRILEELGAVDPGYVDAMLERERGMSTSLGEGFAIPHGTDESRTLIRRTALSFAQFPAGVDWGPDRVIVCIGIAATNDEHIEILGRLANILIQPERAARLRGATSPATVLQVLSLDRESNQQPEVSHQGRTTPLPG